MVLSSTVSATRVNLSIDKAVYLHDEGVMVHLVVDPSEPVGGRLIVYKLGGGKYKLAKLLYTKPTPDECLACARDTPLTSFLDRTFLFSPNGDGFYVVDSNFGGVKETINFTVGSVSTSSTMSVYTTSSTLASSSSSTSSSTSLTTSSTTVLEVTTVLRQSPVGSPRSIPWLALMLVLLVGAFLIHRR